MKQNNILIIQPLLTSYRKNFFDDLSKYFNQITIYANLKNTNGFESNIKGDFKKVHTNIFGKREKLYYQQCVIKAILKEKPNAIFITADFRAIHYYLILLLAKILNIPIFTHGQGLYNKPKAGSIYKILFKTTIGLSSQYICYTKSVYDTLININIPQKKLTVMDNTIVNNFPIKPQEKNGLKNKLLYIGRLRNGSNLELLFDAMNILKEKKLEVSLDIIGDGEKRLDFEEYIKNYNIDVKFHGAIYDDSKITNLSQTCTIGVYPGDAGLSLVHYMSLSLVPIIHKELTLHMGPEPSYIENGINGLTFERNNSQSLASVIEKLLIDKKLVKELSDKAFLTYTDLSHPSMSEKLMEAMNPYLKGGKR